MNLGDMTTVNHCSRHMRGKLIRHVTLAREAHQKWWELQDRTKHTMPTCPPITWNPLLRTTAGFCKYPFRNKGLRIELNPHIYYHVPFKECLETTLHELAHAVCFQFYGRSMKHGPAWKQVMREFGLEPRRCHSYNVDGLRQRRRHRQHLVLCQTCQSKAYIPKKDYYPGVEKLCRCRRCGAMNFAYLGAES